MVGSQLVGLVPKKAMLDAAEYYINKENLFILEEEHKIRLVTCFFKTERSEILEYPMKCINRILLFHTSFHSVSQLAYCVFALLYSENG